MGGFTKEDKISIKRERSPIKKGRGPFSPFGGKKEKNSPHGEKERV